MKDEEEEKDDEEDTEEEEEDQESEEKTEEKEEMKDSEVDKEDLKIYYQNCNGLRTKNEEFKSNCDERDYDFIGLTETWLKEDIHIGDYFSSGDYKVYRKDRYHKQGGGIIMAVRQNKFIVERRTDLETDEVESIWIQVSMGTDCFPLLIGNLYLPPVNSDIMPNSTVRNYCDFFVGKIDVSKYNVICIGDFNAPEPSARFNIIDDLFSDLNIRQQNSVRPSNPNYNLLDFAAANFPLSVKWEPGMVSPDEKHPSILVRFSKGIFQDKYSFLGNTETE
uniref:Endonuclease/exonuclease/phosphatase domain-containing protein n=1 Tax=Cacopsylla melanoneura TaxID=428564 RepID=A0A8D8UW62_9HEMI